MVTTRSAPGKAAVDDFLAAGYTRQNVLVVVLAMGCKTCSNMVDHLAASAPDKPFQVYAMMENA